MKQRCPVVLSVVTSLKSINDAISVDKTRLSSAKKIIESLKTISDTSFYRQDDCVA